jgi:hypothetical protein
MLLRARRLRAVDNMVQVATLLLRSSLIRLPQDNDEVEWQGGRVYLHLGARRDDRPRGWEARPLVLDR